MIFKLKFSYGPRKFMFVDLKWKISKRVSWFLIFCKFILFHAPVNQLSSFLVPSSYSGII